MPEIFVAAPASSTETGAGAAEYAPGTQPWNGTSPPLMNRPQMNAPRAIRTSRFAPGAQTTLWITPNEALCAARTKSAIAVSISTVATADMMMYLKAPSSPCRSRLNAISRNEATAVISRKTYRLNRSLTSTAPFMPISATSSTFMK